MPAARARTARPAELGQAPIVPVSGVSGALTGAASAAMAFIAVLALALAMGAGRLADSWGGALDGTATLRIATDPADRAAATEAALGILAATPGVSRTRVIDAAEQQALLAPWLGADLPVDLLDLPAMIALDTGASFDGAALAARLAGTLPGAVLDDHARWRRPLAQAAGRLRTLAAAAVTLSALATAAMVALAAGLSLATHAQVIAVLRLIGARDAVITRAFTRRFALRALAGATGGTAAAMLALASWPGGSAGVLDGLGPRGADWLVMLAIPPAAALIAWGATRLAATRVLRRQR